MPCLARSLVLYGYSTRFLSDKPVAEADRSSHGVVVVTSLSDRISLNLSFTSSLGHG
jgi:hypothetical protein